MNKIRKSYEWNPVYNLVMKIKDDYNNTFNDGEKQFEKWLEKLNKEEYNKVFDKIEKAQEGDKLIIRYGVEELDLGLWEDPNSIFRECRSIVIDIENEAIVICPFRKFFNLNEVAENKLDVIAKEIEEAETFEVTNKLDGSMQCATFYNGEIFMSGSRSINPKKSWRLATGYSYLTDGIRKMIMNNPGFTFIFEFICLKDAHVVIYDKKDEGLYLIGIRSNTTGLQMSYIECLKMAIVYDIKTAEIENIGLEEMLQQMKVIKSNEKEGWVMNIDGHRVKLKGDDYVGIHRILNKVSSINVILKNVADGTLDDLLSKIPEIYIERVIHVINKLIEYRDATMLQIYNYIDNIPKDVEFKDQMIWINNNVPKEIREYVRQKFLGKEINLFKNSSGGYRKLNQLGITIDFEEEN